MSAINARGRRRRKPTQAYNATPHSTAEEKLLQQAIANSRLDRHRPKDGWLSVPFGPTFHPTVEEFEGNPLHYVNKIRPIAEKYGICKIVPPPGWNPPFCVDINTKKEFQTKDQLLHRLQEGISFGDGKDYSPSEYVKMAREKAMQWRGMYYPEHDGYNENGATANGEGASDPPEVPPVDGVRSESAPSTGDDAKAEPAFSSEDKEEDNERKSMTPENLERDYWNIVETHSQSVAVEYGNDVDTEAFGSGFPRSERGRSVGSTIDVDKVHLPEPKFGTEEFYKETWWNLNNIPSAPDSILRHVKVGINGINVPWMYYGCLFSSFCWHNEDNYLYSINYHHWGAPKQWYGVPGTQKDADGLERVFKNYLSMKMRDVPDLLHHITTMFSPRLLQQGGVPVYKILQNAGEFVITFPRAFHGGFSYGPNCGEAVNFATADWIHHGADANERYRSFARPAVFSHDRLTFTMANHLKEQKAYGTCKLLVAELQRVIEEELRLRNKLLDAGVRDLSGDISLPRNRLDQLDEESADYDDKRLCHACKHVCFFSCVACECSQSKVSCLRHSHYMCRCPTERKYMMVWSQEEEMVQTLDEVKRYCEALKPHSDGMSDSDLPVAVADEMMPELAPGSAEDSKRHKEQEIDLSQTIPTKYPLNKSSNSVGKPLDSEASGHQAPTTIANDAKRIKLDPGVSEAVNGQNTAKDNVTRVSDVDSSDCEEVVLDETRPPTPQQNEQ